MEAIAIPTQDQVDTPDWVASDMVRWFNLTGKILEPCRGNNMIYQYLPLGSLWCEIKEGVDFHQWTDHADWIIGNPPFNKKEFPLWMKHSFEIADNIVYVMPIRKFFSSNKVMEYSKQFGYLAHVRVYGPGGKLKWNFGHPCGALYWSKVQQDTSWSWYD